MFSCFHMYVFMFSYVCFHMYVFICMFSCVCFHVYVFMCMFSCVCFHASFNVYLLLQEQAYKQGDIFMENEGYVADEQTALIRMLAEKGAPPGYDALSEYVTSGCRVIGLPAKPSSPFFFASKCRNKGMPSFLHRGHKGGMENAKEDLGLIPLGQMRDFNQFEVDDVIYFKEENPSCSKYEFGGGLYMGRNAARYALVLFLHLFYFCTL